MKISTVPIQSIDLSFLGVHDVSVSVKRDDLVDPVISGNKLYKLKYHLDALKQQNKQTLITFGGAYSNHLHATAYAGKQLGIQTIGCIRAEAHELNKLTPTLKDCVHWGMSLEPMSRSEYKLKRESSTASVLDEKYPDAYWIPEGGAGELGVKGAELMLAGVDQTQFDTVMLACGTGTTLAGVIRVSAENIQIIGVPVLKGAKWMAGEVEPYLATSQTNWQLALDYHFSGYGKWNQELIEFIQLVETETNLKLDPVYTGKAFYALVDLMKSGKIDKGSRVL
ncbi:MAG: pyridoxal-phosphate dependent enzyme, partial [Gammaproteobacteria bacterium]|nr:pyridoxal-phosphate dependent enzyme [Gammaproteobacteria bacterium]